MLMVFAVSAGFGGVFGLVLVVDLVLRLLADAFPRLAPARSKEIR